MPEGHRAEVEGNGDVFKNDLIPVEGVVGIASPEMQFFVWRSYRKMSRSVRRMQKKNRKALGSGPS